MKSINIFPFTREFKHIFDLNNIYNLDYEIGILCPESYLADSYLANLQNKYFFNMDEVDKNRNIFIIKDLDIDLIKYGIEISKEITKNNGTVECYFDNTIKNIIGYLDEDFFHLKRLFL